MAPRYFNLRLRLYSLMQRWGHRAAEYLNEAAAAFRSGDVSAAHEIRGRAEEAELCALELEEEVRAAARSEEQHDDEE